MVSMKQKSALATHLLIQASVACSSGPGPLQGRNNKFEINGLADADQNVKTNLDGDLSDTGRSGVNYMQIFCKNVGMLQLRYDITREVSRLCDGSKPTEQFRTYRREGLELVAMNTSANSLTEGDEKKPYKLRFLKNDRDDLRDRSYYELMWVFHVKTRPNMIKKQPLYDFVAKGVSSSLLDLNVDVQRLAPETLTPGGLHLWSHKMTYGLQFTALEDLTLRNQRSTEYNLYQVVSGNEEIGLGIEHLTDSPDGAYEKSSMVNVAFNDGR